MCDNSHQEYLPYTPPALGTSCQKNAQIRSANTHRYCRRLKYSKNKYSILYKTLFFLCTLLTYQQYVRCAWDSIREIHDVKITACLRAKRETWRHFAPIVVPPPSARCCWFCSPAVQFIEFREFARWPALCVFSLLHRLRLNMPVRARARERDSQAT